MGEFGDASVWLAGWSGMPWTCLHADRSISANRELAGRELARLAGQSTPSGLVFRGFFGSGKRDLIEGYLAETNFEAEHVWISGSRFAQTIEYGAIQFLLTEVSASDIESPLHVFSALRNKLSAGKPSLVVLEHCGLIDPLTVAVLAQLQGNGLIHLIVIDDQVDPLPHDIEVMISSQVMTLVPLDLLSLSEAREKMEELLGKQISAHAAISLWQFTGGNIQSLQAAVHDAQTSGYISYIDETAVFAPGPPPVGSRLRQLASARMKNLSPGAARLLGDLANVRSRLLDGELPALSELQRHALVREAGAGMWKVAIPSLQAVLSDELTGSRPRADQSAWGALKERLAKLQAGQQTEQAIIELGRYRLDAERSCRIDQKDDVRSTLLMAELLLGAGRLEDAGKVLNGLSPLGSSERWDGLDNCQRHLSLALAAELAARRNDLDFAHAVLDELVCKASFCSGPRHELGCCMAATGRSLLDTLLQVGRWSDCRHLIACILEGGAGEDAELVRHAEAAQVLLEALTGNRNFALGQMRPLFAQMMNSGDSLDQETAGLLSEVTRFIPEQTNFYEEPLTEMKAESSSLLGLIARSVRAFSQAEFSMLEQIAGDMEERGDRLLASHLYAWALRSADGRQAAQRLEDLQVGQCNDLSSAFRILASAVLTNDLVLVAQGMDKLAVLGYVWHITDDDSPLFRQLSPAQKRQISRSNKASAADNLAAKDLVGVLDNVIPSYVPELTRRERFVAMAAASGLTNQQIARKASVSVRTVEGHLYQVYSKLGINKRTQLADLVAAQRNELSKEGGQA
ncbi:hypothetical protein GT020_12060 [Glutamicibacter soli]|uniref:HTH luxR-type domain-containing protein n=1 Tax=Glutamicibacter soli TaxID=453836 RepID=A0A6L9G6G9_9MICC|nr:helix-turn-helix transcriptional regulator [Glutamicibacter soli]NAZ16788.1 hypothetical protein [Glutamicibacter soli]